MRIVTETHNEAKLRDIAALLDELRADGVQVAPGLTAEKLLRYEQTGLILDLETDRIAGTDSERYALTAKGYSTL